MKIYVGNLSYNTGEDGLRELFESYGEIVSVNVVSDRNTGQSRGFGFVEMANKEDGQKAIDELANKELDGRNLNVNEARPRK